ncbi:hypothetical protein DUI87_19865 [Hirundo rustica rustica]|uniref:Uncharacterized protein n=1 Tax=Hirundo rustica rustica TaxID=333673 RepID=A0A3M0K6E2_HIRRU|nr:hypothetical protein DUI87_19865 [Hirundo rustica rustica]
MQFKAKLWKSQSTMEEQQEGFCTGSDGTDPVTTCHDRPTEQSGMRGTKAKAEEKWSQSFDRVIKSGRKAAADTDYCSQMHLLSLPTYRMELETSKMEGSSPEALKQVLETGPYGETAKGLHFMLDSVPASWRRDHELNVYADLKH